MARKVKKKANAEDHASISVEVTKYDVAIDAARNYELTLYPPDYRLA